MGFCGISDGFQIIQFVTQKVCVRRGVFPQRVSALSALAGVRGRSPRENVGIVQGYNLESVLLRERSVKHFLFGKPLNLEVISVLLTPLHFLQMLDANSMSLILTWMAMTMQNCIFLNSLHRTQ